MTSSVSNEELADRLLLSVSNAVSSSSSSSSKQNAFGRIAISMECCKLRIQHRLRSKFAMVPRIFGRAVPFPSINGGNVDGIDDVVGVIGVNDALDSTVDILGASSSGNWSVFLDDDDIVVFVAILKVAVLLLVFLGIDSSVPIYQKTKE